MSADPTKWDETTSAPPKEGAAPGSSQPRQAEPVTRTDSVPPARPIVDDPDAPRMCDFRAMCEYADELEEHLRIARFDADVARTECDMAIASATMDLRRALQRIAAGPFDYPDRRIARIALDAYWGKDTARTEP